MLKAENSLLPGLVSVIIPTYNRSDLVGNAIDSVLCQTYPLFEIIVVDDCSTDNTISILKKYGDKIRFVKNDSNSYVGFTRNFGVSIANGDYVAFLDSDDKWVPNKLEVQISWMLANKFEISTTNFYVYQEDNDSLLLKHRPYLSELKFTDILYGIYIAPGSTLIIKRDIFIALNGYETSYRRLEDWDLLIKIFLNYKRIGFLSEPTAQIFASNEYTLTKLKESGKKLFMSNYKSLFSVRWYYPILLLVGILFEFFVASFRTKRYFMAALYFIILNALSLFRNPYFEIHSNSFKKCFNKVQR